jgi:hypothetical protein
LLNCDSIQVWGRVCPSYNIPGKDEVAGPWIILRRSEALRTRPVAKCGLSWTFSQPENSILMSLKYFFFLLVNWDLFFPSATKIETRALCLLDECCTI